MKEIHGLHWDMEKMPLNLMDLVPKDATLALSGINQPLTLGRWSLRVRNWAKEKFGSDGLQEIFVEQKIDEIADIAWFMLKEKDLFNGEKDNFLDAISSPRDQLNLVTAMLESVGIGEPEIKKINDKIKKDEAGGDPNPNRQRPGKKTGAKSSTR